MNTNEDRAAAPHCDAAVLHAPGKCEYCDEFSDWQEMRNRWRISFSGEHDPLKAPCPSTARRPERDVNHWPGNRPEGYKDIDADYSDAGALDHAASVLLRRTIHPKSFWLRVIVNFLQSTARDIRNPERIKR